MSLTYAQGVPYPTARETWAETVDMIARCAMRQTGEIPEWIETRKATTPPVADRAWSSTPEIREEPMGDPEARGLSD